VGDPTTREWSPGSFSRHQLQYTLSREFFERVTLRWFGNLRSGTPYTPIIAGDINGDSYNNDRAFIFNPATTSDPLVANALNTLLATGTREARACLQSQLGTLAGRNSCTGPWTTNANLSVSLNSVRLGLPQRATISLQISNPLGGIDRLLNGEENLKGWGQVIIPEQQLLFVRGFDPQAQVFAYEVNERFGSTRPSQTTFRQPVAMTALVSFDIGPTRERQQLLQQLDRGRTRAGTKPTLQQLRGTVSAGLINPMQQILVQSDSLQLTRRQADSLATLNRWYVLSSDRIWAPIAAELADLPDRYNHDRAFTMYRRGREQSVDMLLKVVPDIKGLLTTEQYRMLPPQLAAFMDARTLRALRSGTAGGGGGMGGMGGFGGGMGGGGFGGRGRG